MTSAAVSIRGDGVVQAEPAVRDNRLRLVAAVFDSYLGSAKSRHSVAV